MKNFVPIFLCFFFPICVIASVPDSTPTFPPAMPGFEYSGDMNMNHVHTTEDAQLTFLAALGMWFPYLAGDCNGDDQITAGDAGAIFQTMMDIMTCAAPIPTPVSPLTPTPTPAPGPEQVMLTGGLYIGCPGDSLQMSVTMENPLTDVDCFGLEFHFDTHAMAYTGYDTGDLDPGWIMFDCHELEPGRVRACGYCIGTPIPSGSSGTILAFTFQTTCSDCYWGEMYPYTFDWLVDDIHTFYPVNGTLEVQCIRPVHNGDTNLDHQVSSGDAQLAFLGVLGLVTLNFQQFTTGDCNMDYELTSEDAQLIFQTVLGQAACADPL